MSRTMPRRPPRRRRRSRLRPLLLAVLFLAVLGGLGSVALQWEWGDDADGSGGRSGQAEAAAPEPTAGQAVLGPIEGGIDLADEDDPVELKFKRPPRAALLVNLDTGEVLWRRNAERTLPIASLTKMMTGLVAVDELAPGDKARVTKAVLNYTGSGMGVLPKGKRVKVETLLYGLMLPSGNDAARALAFRAAGSIQGFVDKMNAKAGAMGLRCTQFAGVEGLSPRNRSCPADLAVMARAVLDNKRLARIVRTRQAVRPFPIKGGKVYLYNHNPLMRAGYQGTIGVKTGFTDEAGRCFVAAVKRNGVRLAAIVLHSENPGKQTRQMLDRGFEVLSD